MFCLHDVLAKFIAFTYLQRPLYLFKLVGILHKTAINGYVQSNTKIKHRFFRFAFCKSLYIRRFTLDHTFFCLSLSLSLLIFTMDNRQPVYNILKLSLSLFLFISPKVFPFIANANLWTFSSLFLLEVFSFLYIFCTIKK